MAYSPRSMSRFRACWAVHAPVGRADTPRMCTRRVWISIAKNTYGRWRNTVSTCTKSHARIPAAWEARNCRQVGDARRGTGVSPASAGSAGWFLRRCNAQGRRVRLGCAGVPTAGSAWPAAGPAHGSPPGPAAPGGARIGPLLLTMRRCQASSVAGVTIRCSRRCPGSSRASAAIATRSAQSGFGRATWRCRTATSCRSTKISTSLEVSLRASSASQPNNRIMSR